MLHLKKNPKAGSGTETVVEIIGVSHHAWLEFFFGTGV
jgi:hypothetical protein